MPIMLPPGQGVTVQLPQQGATVTQPTGTTTTPQQPAAPPEPFRRVSGPDVALLPHGKIEEGSQQMSRKGRKLKFSRDDVMGMHRALTENPHDRATWLHMSDYFEENGKDTIRDIFRTLASKGNNYTRAIPSASNPTVDSKFMHHNDYADHIGMGQYIDSEGNWNPALRRLSTTGTIHGVPIRTTLFERDEKPFTMVSILNQTPASETNYAHHIIGLADFDGEDMFHRLHEDMDK